MDTKSGEEQVLVLMKEDLPEYLQNVLLACGYDKMSAIAKMLQYINENLDDHSM